MIASGAPDTPCGPWEVPAEQATTRCKRCPSTSKLEAPQDYDRAGWWHKGTRPGDVGPAVIAGHVDSVDGPAIFYRLDELEQGSVVDVLREDGKTVRFSVDRVERHPKDDFPTEEVYGNVSRPEIRLITCGGDFNDDTGHYEDNVVVFGHMV